MCVIFFAYDVHPEYPLVLLANRDEFYDRPTARAAYWDDHPDIFAGRDLVARGTWLGITRQGRFGAVTNYREPDVPKGRRSRGELVADFLKRNDSVEGYLEEIRERSGDYSGFNLLLGEFGGADTKLFYFSNRGDGVRRLASGVFGLSNHLLGTPWPKLRRGTNRFRELLASPLVKDDLFDLLAEEVLAADEELPDTGVGYEKEKLLSAIFIRTPDYGTRSSSVVTFSHNSDPTLEERVFV
jgi:uncharacterized protein with NRDE domain